MEEETKGTVDLIRDTINHGGTSGLDVDEGSDVSNTGRKKMLFISVGIVVVGGCLGGGAFGILAKKFRYRQIWKSKNQCRRSL